MTDQIFPDESLHRFRQAPHDLPRIPPGDSAVLHRGLTDHILSVKMKSKLQIQALILLLPVPQQMLHRVLPQFQHQKNDSDNAS